MSLRKLKDFEGEFFCSAYDHNPPVDVSLSPGIYEYICPWCKHKQIFLVRQEYYL